MADTLQPRRRCGAISLVVLSLNDVVALVPQFIENFQDMQQDRPQGEWCLPRDCLELEITESAIMAQPAQASAMLEAIAAAGVHLAIDDFGTGYSSLAYLQRMPADVVKIDQSFVRELEHDARQQCLVKAMINLSQELGHRVVAEGVENEAVLALLRQAGCDEAQGYLIARPLKVADFAGWYVSRLVGQAQLLAGAKPLPQELLSAI